MHCKLFHPDNRSTRDTITRASSTYRARTSYTPWRSNYNVLAAACIFSIEVDHSRHWIIRRFFSIAPTCA
ncbi:hypothetical protein, partial [Parasphingorhabdus sp.]|uniref:hypothetical protein n=1 Tax=Parasphingorhabdus sp. TaxID=2709688 RepID=UPI0030026B91